MIPGDPGVIQGAKCGLLDKVLGGREEVILMEEVDTKWSSIWSLREAGCSRGEVGGRGRKESGSLAGCLIALGRCQV